MAKIRQQGTKARNELIEGDIISHFEGETGMMVSRDSRHGVNRILLTLKADVDETSSSIWVDADGSIVNYYGNLFQDLILEDEEKPKGRSVETKNESQENNAPYWLGVELMGGQKLLINLVERDVEILVDSKKDEWDYVNGVEKREIGIIIPMKDQAGRETKVAIETTAPYTINRAIDDQGLWTNVTDAQWVVSPEDGFVFRTDLKGNVSLQK